jgi:tetratricopeptide (TPR) repeat protein
MAVSLPLVMLLVYYYLKRQWSKRLLLEKLPVFFVAGICAIITFLIQKHAGAVTDLPALSHVQRLCVPFYCLLFYIVKTLIPLHLSALYFLPHHIGKTTSLMLYGSPFVVAAGAGLLWYFRAYGRTMVFGLAFMIITLVPVLQIVPVGAALVADRYTYIAFVGIYLLAGTFLYKLIFETLKRKPDMRTMVYVLLAVVCTTLCVLTYKRCEVWKDSFTLWNDVIGKYPSAIAYNNLGTAYSDLENNDKTIYYATKALELDSTYVLAYNNRGSAYSRTGIQNMAMYNKDYGTFKCAIDDFSRALTLKPDYAQAYANRGNVYSAQKLYERAFADYARSIQFQPKNSEVYYNRGLLYNELGQFDNAIINFNKAIVISPGAAHVYNDRGVAYAQKGNLGQAIADFRTSLSLRPSAPDVEGNLNRALEMLNSVPAPTDAMHEK